MEILWDTKNSTGGAEQERVISCLSLSSLLLGLSSLEFILEITLEIGFGSFCCSRKTSVLMRTLWDMYNMYNDS